MPDSLNIQRIEQNQREELERQRRERENQREQEEREEQRLVALYEELTAQGWPDYEERQAREREAKQKEREEKLREIEEEYGPER